MDYGLWIQFHIYVDRIKPEKSGVGFRLMLGLLFGGLSQCCQIIPVLKVSQCLVLFYNHFHYRRRFNDFRYEIRF